MTNSPGIGQNRVSLRRVLEMLRIFRPTGTTLLRHSQLKMMIMQNKMKKSLKTEYIPLQDKVDQQPSSKILRKKC